MTPRRPRRRSLRRKSVQNGLGFRGADVHAEHLAPAVAVDADGDDHRHRDDAAVLAHLHVGGVDPQIGPVAFDRAVEEGLDPLVDLLAQPADLALGDAAHAQRLDQVVDRARRDALDVGFLDHRGQRLLGHPARLQEAREVAALAQLRDAQLDRAGPRLPVAVAVAVALDQPLGALLAIAPRRSGRRPPAPSAARRQSRSSRAEYRRRGSSPPAREGSSSRRSSVVPRLRWSVATRPYRRIVDDHRKPLARYGAMRSALASGFATAELHHHRGHDPIRGASGTHPASIPLAVGEALKIDSQGVTLGGDLRQAGSARGARLNRAFRRTARLPASAAERRFTNIRRDSGPEGRSANANCGLWLTEIA